MDLQFQTDQVVIRGLNLPEKEFLQKFHGGSALFDGANIVVVTRAKMLAAQQAKGVKVAPAQAGTPATPAAPATPPAVPKARKSKKAKALQPVG